MNIIITWPDVLAGAFLGYILGNIHNLKSFILSIFRDQYKGYYGKYFLYGYLLEKNEHDKYIDYIELKVTKSFFGTPDIEYIDDQYSCKGKMFFDEKNIYFHLKGSNHDGDYFMVFHKPLVPIDFDLRLGAKTLITEKSDPAATINLITRKTLDDDDAKALLGARRIIVVKDSTKFKERSIALKNRNRIA